MNVPVISGTLNNLDGTGVYFNQVLSISSDPTSIFTMTNWSSLIDLIMSLLTNPFFYGIILLILVMSVLPTFEDE